MHTQTARSAAALLILCLVLPSLAALGQEDALLEVNFEETTLPASLVLPDRLDYTIANGVLKLTTGDEWAAFWIDETAADYALETTIKISADTTMYIGLRDQNTTKLCSYGAWLDSTGIDMGVWTGEDCDEDSEWTTQTSESFAFPIDQWVDVRLEVQGDTLSIEIDGEQVASTEDTTYAEGNTLIAISNNTEVLFDDLALYDLGSAGKTISLAPKPQPSGTEQLPATLENYDQGYKAVVEELQETGAIPLGGKLVFMEDYAYFTGKGQWFTELARRSPAEDVIMAGELTYTAGETDEIETCTLMLRIEDPPGSTSVEDYLIAGLASGGIIYASDNRNEDNFFALDLDLSLDSPHDLLIIAIEDKLTLYVDGERIFEEVSITPARGYYGIALSGQGRGARCEGRDIWAYEVWTEGALRCTVSGQGINLRAGPGTHYEIAGTLSGNQKADGQTEAEDGFTWFRLAGGDWVRSDVVSVEGNCNTLPEVQAP